MAKRKYMGFDWAFGSCSDSTLGQHPDRGRRVLGRRCREKGEAGRAPTCSLDTVYTMDTYAR